MNKPTCSLSPDGKSVTICAKPDCDFCSLYAKASGLFHVCRHESESGKGIDRLIAFWIEAYEKGKKEQMYLFAAKMATEEQNKVMEQSLKTGCPCVELKGYEKCGNSGCWEAGYRKGQEDASSSPSGA